MEVINNFYKVHSIKLAFRYLHSAAGLPPKITWIKSVCMGNYFLLTIFSRVRGNAEGKNEESMARHIINQANRNFTHNRYQCKPCTNPCQCPLHRTSIPLYPQRCRFTTQNNLDQERLHGKLFFVNNFFQSQRKR